MTLSLLLMLAAVDQDVVVMRRSIAPPQPRATAPTTNPTPTPTPTAALDTDQSQTGSVTTAAVPAGSTLDSIHAVRSVDGKRSYTGWTFQAPRSVGPGCDAKMPAISDQITCRDVTTMQALPDAMCPFAKPSGWVAEELRTCQARWVTGEPYLPPETCSATARKTTSVECRVFPANPQKAAYYSTDCTAPKPQTEEIVEYYGGCNHAWKTTSTTYASTCSDSTTKTDVQQCFRSGGLRNPSDPETAYVAASYCGGTVDKRIDTPGVSNLEGCSRHWAKKPGAWSATCGAATRQVAAVCMMTVGGVDREVADGQCSGVGAKPVYADETSDQTSGCTATCDAPKLNTTASYTWKANATNKNNTYRGELSAPYANGKLTDAGVNAIMTYCRKQTGHDVCYAFKSSPNMVSMFTTAANQMQSVTYSANNDVYLVTRCLAK